ncbi:hypothetical protein RhiirC2_784359 [Rhizophagus irregularis]|uniref:Uncharacterized protein n=1 Tax=Rhizophagus irregularis TaxID=588596 RepID=A0A2N1MYN7_9GLOM|nr:hypothetical protein RhiirC2_784359 [Rhizophagus irregularis]
MEEETLKQYMNEYYRGFTGFELEHLEDFAKCLKEYKEFKLAEYEVAHLDKDILFPPGDIKIGVRDARTTSSNNFRNNHIGKISQGRNKPGENTTGKEIDREKITNFVKSHMVLFYKSFFHFEKQYIDDFVTAIKDKARVDLEDYEISHLDEDLLLPRGKTPPGVRDKEKKMGADLIKDNLMDVAAFTMKKGADIATKILISLGYSHFEDLEAKETAVEELRKTKDELNSLIAKHEEDKEKIDNLEKEKKIKDERIRNLENEVIKLQELEKKKITSEISTSIIYGHLCP